MVEIKTTGDKLKEIFTISGVCNGDIIMKFGAEDMSVFSRDPSNSSMMLSIFNKGYFTNYVGNDEILGFSRDAFSIVNKRLKKNDANLITMGNKVLVSENRTTWTVNTLGDIDARMPSPKFETGILFSMPMADFQESIVRARDGGDHITFTMTKNDLIISGGDYEDKNRIYSVFDTKTLTNYVYEPISGAEKSIATYGGDFFDCLRMYPSDAILEVRLDAERPIRVIAHDESSNYKYEYIVAPIIESE